MNDLEKAEMLRAADPDLAAAISSVLTAQTHRAMPDLGDRIGLEIVPEAENRSKKDRAALSLQGLSRQRLAEIARDLGSVSGSHGLEEYGWSVLEERLPPITEITRRDVAKCFGHDLSGERSLTGLVKALFPVGGLVDFEFSFLSPGRTLEDDIRKHMIDNDDWSVEDLFEKIGALHCSLHRFGALLEAALHPLARRGPEEPALVEALNTVLRRDGYHLAIAGEESQHPLYRLESLVRGVAGAPKNLIFASDGAKPRIGFSDAINNDIVILSNAQSCLVYDRPIGRGGLLWSELVTWWRARDEAVDDPATDLARRLFRSLDSDGEKNLFRTYFTLYRPKLGDALPALVPQVYLHYDPAIARDLDERHRMFRQRMDFLLLLPNAQRVVLEVDGAQHFSTAGAASLPLYARMVSADRDLRLTGYEVFRFGANELVGPGAEGTIRIFFDRLFTRHGLAGSSS